MIYFDNSATTKVDSTVLDTYLKVSEQFYGNPSSLHLLGDAPAKLLAQSRVQIENSLNGTEITISHDNTSDAESMTTGGRTYINSITLDEYGHVTDLDTGTETVVDTNTTYSQSWVDSETNAILRLTAGGSGSGNDDLTLVAGDNIALTPSGDNLTIEATNTYPTTFKWSNGTDAGPTGSLTGTSQTVSFGAIPDATDLRSGVVTTGVQTFKGEKTFSDNTTISGNLEVSGDDGIKIKGSSLVWDSVSESLRFIFPE